MKETKRLRLLHVRAIRYLQAIDKKAEQIRDLDTRLAIEHAKSTIESFLTANEDWYLEEIVKAVDVIAFCEIRHQKIILEINEILIKYVEAN
jgi:hypothetical protein